MIEEKKLNDIIDELIDLSNTKYGLLKVGRDTLNVDILFIEKFSELKLKLGVESLHEADLSKYPKMKNLIELIKKINQYEDENRVTNKRVNQAINAYKK
ncbi:MAG: hypothetical protein JXR88_03260 [Clostridia bacterium]|nr:hypothetical protein [Clostridia bacterium]